MSADLVDPFARPEPVHYQVNAYDMCDQITYKVRTSQDNDRELMPQLIQRTLQRLRQAADDGTPEVAGFARWVLEDLWHRAETGVPYGEPRDDWPDPRESLIDREPGLRHGQYIRRVETVVEDL